jgi:lipid A 4'-phosphatase
LILFFDARWKTFETFEIVAVEVLAAMRRLPDGLFAPLRSAEAAPAQDTEAALPHSLRRVCGGKAARAIAITLAFVVVVSVSFLTMPEIDLWFSGLFYSPAARFFLGSVWLLVALRQSGNWVVILAATLLTLQILLKLAQPGRASFVPPSITIFLLSTLMLGPGLLVNAILKNNWGRPRPAMVHQFGGNQPYVDVWRVTDYCHSNCSFVSGEASSAIWLTALAFVVPQRWRIPVALLTGTYALVLSLNRIAIGGHFLSDVLLSWGLTFLVMLLVWRFIVEMPPSWLSNEKMEARLTALGWRLRGKKSS